MKTTQGRCNAKIYEKQKKIPDKRLNQKKGIELLVENAE